MVNTDLAFSQGVELVQNWTVNDVIDANFTNAFVVQEENKLSDSSEDVVRIKVPKQGNKKVKKHENKARLLLSGEPL